MTLTSCNAAILLPNELTLINKSDSIQTYDPLQPNQSQSRYWMLKTNINTVIDTTAMIQWKWNCNELSGDTSCVHSVIITTKNKEGLIVTSWLLRFRAKQNGPLPNAQQFNLYTTNMMTIPWQAATSLPWLNYNPTNSDKSELINVQPNTTSMPIGVYTGLLQFKPTSPYIGVDVGVEYEIYKITNVAHEQTPSSFYLGQNYPNPFSDQTVIRFRLSSSCRVTIKLYDVLGREVVTVLDKDVLSGENRVLLDRSTIGNNISPGMYFYRILANGQTHTRTLILTK